MADSERLVSSESESDDDASDDATTPETPEQPVDLLNLGGGATSPEPQVSAPPASGSYFDLMSGSGGNAMMDGSNQLLDFTAHSAPPVGQPHVNGGNIDLLGGFDGMSMEASSSNNTNLLQPQAGNLSSHASSASSLIDQDFMNFMGSSTQLHVGQSSSSTDNLLAGFGSGSTSQMPSNINRNSNLPTNAAHLHSGKLQIRLLHCFTSCCLAVTEHALLLHIVLCLFHIVVFLFDSDIISSRYCSNPFHQLVCVCHVCAVL